MRDVPSLKERVDLRALVGDTHDLGANGKLLCPFHDDRVPSLHVYRDGFYCFGCGARGDHLDWLVAVEGLRMRDALEALERLAGAAPPAPRPRRSRRRRLRDRAPAPLPGRVRQRFERALARTRRVPAALEGRGLDPAAMRRLELAALGGDALIPLRAPGGRLVAVKRRFSRPADGTGGPRYAYLAAGGGAPAWRSPDLEGGVAVLAVEGELNGMVAWLALREAGARVGVLGAAGAAGRLPERALAGRDVWLLADGDAAGRAALGRWSGAARLAGARDVRLLPPFPEGDACDVAGRFGRTGLAARLLEAMFLSAGEEVEHARRPEDDAERHAPGALP